MKEDKTWDILTSDEQTAITLSLSHGKSSWEVGEIMGKSHYKYLEISARAKRFYKLFIEYFADHGQLFPEGVIIDDRFRDYIEKAILDRLPLKHILNFIGDKEYTIARKRRTHIVNQMKSLRSQSKGRDTHDLILEFDRWNNFRILPQEIQEPSAFKRREKTKEKNRLKLVSKLPPMSIDLIVNRYKYEGKLKCLYLPLVDKRHAAGFVIVPVKKHTTTISGISYLGLPLFEKRDTAKDYIILVHDFIEDDTKSCVKGLHFWPQFRVLNKSAHNYDRLENIKVNRKYYEKVFDEDLVRVKKMKKRKEFKQSGAKPITPNTIWDI